MGLITKADILGAADITFEEVEVPEWGGSVRIASLNGADREIFESVWVNQSYKEDSQIRATLAALSIVDAEGKKLFTVKDIDKLGKKSYKALDRVFLAAKKLNALDESDEDIEKN